MKKLKAILFLFLSSSLLSPIFSQYNWQNLPNAPKSWRCDDMFFLNSQIGWVIHPYYDYLSPNQYGQVYKTWDGGATWMLMHDSSKTFYRSVGFIDSLHGWVGNLADTAHYAAIYGHQATQDTTPLYQTNDGGKTLTPVNLPQPHPAGICGISIVNDSIIFAYGRYIGPAGYVKTIDRGKTWIYKNMNSLAFGLVDGWFFNKDTGFITGASPAYKAQILSTVDGGNSWQIAYRSTRVDTDEVWKIFFPSRDTGYASIEYQPNVFTSSLRYFVKTTNGGKTWTEIPFIQNYDLEGIGFINDSTGWIGGDWELPTYITFDRGNTWLADNDFGVAEPPYWGGKGNNNISINRFRKLNDTLMFASGNTVYKLSGKITGINELSSNKYQVSNYPNPFTTQTTIEYSLSQECHNVKIEAFSNRGQLIFSQNLGSQSPGKHEFVFKGEMLSGAYFYTITSDEYTVTRKMIRVK
jgi:photosystem II stability/assembly factor-like uncharacterized protein